MYPVVILAGGLGTRLREETETKPKPMVEIGDKPIVWHIMKYYYSFGVREFVICLGYRGEVIKDFFLRYREQTGSLTIDFERGVVKQHSEDLNEKWTVHLLETGQETMTGGRVKRAAEFLGNRSFMLTYGDGVSNVDIDALIRTHKAEGKIATITAVRPPARFGGLSLDGNKVVQFEEKPQIGDGWINGGFMVMEPDVARYLEDDATILERKPFEKLSALDQLTAYRHEGFWQCVDTLRDLTYLRNLWESTPPWKRW